jgi:hypothetical protein
LRTGRKAGKVIDGEFMSITLNVTIPFNGTAYVSLVLKEPDNWYREVELSGIIQVHDHDFGF